MCDFLQFYPLYNINSRQELRHRNCSFWTTLKALDAKFLPSDQIYIEIELKMIDCVFYKA